MANHIHICPTCHKPVSWDGNTFRPFCSDRCRLIDLQGWLDEQYRFPQDTHSESADVMEHKDGQVPETDNF